MQIKTLSTIAALTLAAALLVAFVPASAATSTFGRTANGGSAQTNSTDRKYVSSASPSVSCTVTSGTARVWIPTSGTSNSRLVIYSDNAGAPDALVAYSDEVAISNRTEAAIDYTFSGAQQVNVTAGTSYWIGVHFTDPGATNFTISRANTTGVVRSLPDTYADGPEDPFGGSPVSSNGPLDIYIACTYSLSKTETITDNFDDNSLDAAKWSSWGGANLTEQNQQLEIKTTMTADYYGLDSVSRYDLTDSSLAVKVVDAGNQSINSLEVLPIVALSDANNSFFFLISGGSISGYKKRGGNNYSISSATYNASTHQYIRLREASGTTYFDYSADGLSWSTLGSTTTAPVDATSMLLQIEAGQWAVETASTTIIVDDVNILPTAAAPITSDLIIFE